MLVLSSLVLCLIPMLRICFFLYKYSDFIRHSPETISPAIHRVFKIRESSHKTHLERHKEQIKTILSHLDELPLERIEHMEDKIEGLLDFNFRRTTHRGYPDSPPTDLKSLLDKILSDSRTTRENHQTTRLDHYHSSAFC
ncbi:hypothetical protein Tco_0017352 [Tanacetum coccineum]